MCVPTLFDPVRRVLVPVVVAALGLLAATIGVAAGAIPEPAADEPVWYALVALVVGYWAAAVRWARSPPGERGTDERR